MTDVQIRGEDVLAATETQRNAALSELARLRAALETAKRRIIEQDDELALLRRPVKEADEIGRLHIVGEPTNAVGH